MTRRIRTNLTYPRLIVCGFLAVILIGAVLLTLPAASRSGHATPITDSIFTSVSAACVTGLIVFDTLSHWSAFGQAVILALIQVGGLGFMTMVTLMMSAAGKRLGLTGRRIVMETSGSMSMENTSLLVKRIAIGTFAAEAVGALVLFIAFSRDMPSGTAVWCSVFHSVSAFCNAGFDIFGTVGGGSFTQYASDPLVCVTLMLLIITGGLGFVVWGSVFKGRFRFKKLSLHAKLVIITTLSLIFGGAVIFFFTEKDASMAGMNFGQRVLASFFQSVTTRTAGFNTVSQGALSDSGSMVSLILMFIGGSSGSTAGGVKTTTAAILILNILSAAKNEEHVEVFKRRVDDRTVSQATAIVGLYMLLVIISTVVLCTIENFGIRETSFEVVSAIGTVGLTMGITPLLTIPSKLIVALLMFVGRIGGMSFALALAEKKEKTPLERPTERIMIG